MFGEKASRERTERCPGCHPERPAVILSEAKDLCLLFSFAQDDRPSLQMSKRSETVRTTCHIEQQISPIRPHSFARHDSLISVYPTGY
jgi:hypothetical protein